MKKPASLIIILSLCTVLIHISSGLDIPCLWMEEEPVSAASLRPLASKRSVKDVVLIMAGNGESRARHLLKTSLDSSFSIKLSKRICSRVIDSLFKREISSKLLSEIPWSMDLECFPTDPAGHFRPFSDEEMFEVLKRLNSKLLVMGIGVDEKLPYAKYPEPIEMLEKVLVDKSYGGESLQIHHIKQFVEDMILFFGYFIKALWADRDIQVVYLARDGLSAYEFHRYILLLLNEKFKITSIYHSGMDPEAVVSDYTPDEGIRKLWRLKESTKKGVIREFLERGRIPKGNADVFYDEYRPKLFRDISGEFTKRLIGCWQEDESLRKEAEVLYKQMEKHGIAGEKKVVFVDLRATGKSLLYVKSVLEYFSLINGRGSPNVNVFLGWSDNRRLCLPELRLVSNEFRERRRPFKDLPWPFYRTHQDEEGQVFFKLHNKRAIFLQHLFRSMVIYNAALKFVHKRGVMPIYRQAPQGDFRESPERSAPKHEISSNFKVVAGITSAA